MGGAHVLQAFLSVLARTLLGMARSGVAEVAADLAPALVAGADQLLRAGTSVPPVTVHMICADLDPPYVGYVACRSFEAGRDAATAVGLLGRLPSVVAATHLVVAWEYSALRAALEPALGRGPTGLAVVEASFDEHLVRWFPFRRMARGNGVEWGRSRVHPGGALPLPVEYLLSSWRSLIVDDVAATVDMLERAAYRVRWTARS